MDSNISIYRQYSRSSTSCTPSLWLDLPLHEGGYTNLPTCLKHRYNVFPKRPLIRGGGWILVEVPRFEEMRDQEALKVLYLVHGYF